MFPHQLRNWRTKKELNKLREQSKQRILKEGKCNQNKRKWVKNGGRNWGQKTQTIRSRKENSICVVINHKKAKKYYSDLNFF